MNIKKFSNDFFLNYDLNTIIISMMLEKLTLSYIFISNSTSSDESFNDTSVGVNFCINIFFCAKNTNNLTWN